MYAWKFLNKWKGIFKQKILEFKSEISFNTFTKLFGKFLTIFLKQLSNLGQRAHNNCGLGFGTIV